MSGKIDSLKGRYGDKKKKKGFQGLHLYALLMNGTMHKGDVVEGLEES